MAYRTGRSGTDPGERDQNTSFGRVAMSMSFM